MLIGPHDGRVSGRVFLGFRTRMVVNRRARSIRLPWLSDQPILALGTLIVRTYHYTYYIASLDLFKLGFYIGPTKSSLYSYTYDVL